MQSQLALQLPDLALVAGQPQRGRAQDRAQQGMRGHFGQTIGQAHRQPDGGGRSGHRHRLRDRLPQLKDGFGPHKHRLPGLGQRQFAARRLEELVTQLLLQRLDLGADGLNGHVQALGSAGKAPLFGHHPK